MRTKFLIFQPPNPWLIVYDNVGLEVIPVRSIIYRLSRNKECTALFCQKFDNEILLQLSHAALKITRQDVQQIQKFDKED